MATNLYDYKDVKINTSRNGFDNGAKRAFSAKAGELVMPWWTIMDEGDTLQFNVQHFTRTRPVQTSAFTRIREYFDFYAVRMPIMWKSWRPSKTQMPDASVQAVSMTESLQITEEHPYFTLQDLVSYKNPSVLKNTGAYLDSVPPMHTSSHYNYFGFYRPYLIAKHFQYLGYFRLTDDLICNKDFNDFLDSADDVYRYSMPVNIFPLLAYQKVYNDFYRNQQWEKANPFCWNVDYSSGGHITLPSSNDDYWSNNTMFDIRYCNWNKDMFMGMLPESQYGDPAAVAVQFPDGNISVNLPDSRAVMKNGKIQGNIGVTGGSLRFKDLGLVPSAQPNSDATFVFQSYDSENDTVVASDKPTNLRVGGTVTIPARTVEIDTSSYSATFTVLSLRMQEALQRWKEVAQCGRQDYRDQIYRQFGVTLPDELSDLAEYIGGDANNLDISEVVNTNLTGDAQTDIQGKGVGVGDFGFKWTAKEACVVVCLYHAIPLLDYDISGISKWLTATTTHDYPMPAFDRIGLEELPIYHFSNVGFRKTYTEDGQVQFGTVNNILPKDPVTIGYVPRYIEAKTDIDRVMGAFSNSEVSWVAPVSDDYLFENIKGQLSPGSGINYNFFKVNPHILDSVFFLNADSTCDTDQFLVNSFFDVKRVANLDYNGLPY